MSPYSNDIKYNIFDISFLYSHLEDPCFVGHYPFLSSDLSTINSE